MPLPASQLQRQTRWVGRRFALGAWNSQQQWHMFLVDIVVCVKSMLHWLAHSALYAGQQRMVLSAYLTREVTSCFPFIRFFLKRISSESGANSNLNWEIFSASAETNSNLNWKVPNAKAQTSSIGTNPAEAVCIRHAHCLHYFEFKCDMVGI